MSRDAQLVDVISVALREAVEDDARPDSGEVQRIARAVRAGLGDPDATTDDAEALGDVRDEESVRR